MNMTEYARLIATAQRFNENCDEKGIPCRAETKKIWLDLGAGWADFSIVIRDLTRPASDICSSVQVDFRDREDAMKGDIDAVVERLLQYGTVTRNQENEL